MEKEKNIETVDAIENYLNGITSDFSELYMLGCNSVIIKYLKKYLEIYPERAYEINMLIDNIDTLKHEHYEKENLIRVLEKHSDDFSCNYADLILNLLVKNEFDAIRYLKNNKITINKINKSLEKFLKVYPNQKEEVNYILNIINKYEGELSKEKTKKKDYINVALFYDKKDKDNINKKFECLYLSNLSIEEFCSLTGEAIASIKSIVSSNINIESSCEKAKDILERIPSDEFINKIISLSYEIDTNDFLDALDYFEVTRLKNSDFRDLISKYFAQKDLVRIIKKLNQVVKINPNINKTIELNSKKIIGGREISLEEKEAIFKFLEENNLPLGLYNVALKRYLNNNLKVLKK